MRFLFVDRILEMLPGEQVRGIKHVTRDDVYLSQDKALHFCFAPSFIGEALGQLTAWNVMFAHDFRYRPVAGVVSSARLFRPVYLGETIFLESFIDSLDEQAVQYHSIAKVGSETVFSIEGALGPLLPMEQFISENVVRQQFAEINRPGEWLPFTQTSCQAPAFLIPYRHVPMAFDRILKSEPSVSMIAEKRISGVAPFFPDHFPLKPVLPMTVLLQCQLDLAKQFLKEAALSSPYQVSELRKIKMNDFVYPGDMVICTLSVFKQEGEEIILRTRSEVEGKRICIVDIVMRALTHDK